MHPITILGTGLAGYTVARELRKLDKESPLRLISADDGCFYSKPMLSNAFLEKKTPENLVITPATKMATQVKAEILTHTQVTQVDPQHHAVYVGDKRLEYSKLVLAQGAEPIRLPLAGDAADKVLSVNNLTDYTRFRAALENAKRVSIMGAGLIGCEFANDLQPAGFEVTLIDPAKLALGRLVPEAVGQVLQQALQGLGITLYPERAVNHVDFADFGDFSDSGYRLTLTDDSVLEADVVLSAIGLRPRTDLVAAAGLSVERGIVVDRYLKTSADDVYAVGDCAEVEGLVLPFVMPLMNAARAVAKTLTGQLTAVKYPAMPVVVKTPACPLVVSPPAARLEGEWEIEAQGVDVRALFYTPDRQLGGFVLTGAKVAEKMRLAKKLPPLFA
jgi:rubredoxin-NAD+ reductase